MLINRIKNIKIHWQDNDQFFSWRLLNLIVSGVLLTGMLLAVIFIYRNINIALTNAAIISDIKSNINFNTLDTAGFEQAKKNINYKKQLLAFPANVRNIFAYSDKTTTNASTDQTKK